MTPQEFRECRINIDLMGTGKSVTQEMLAGWLHVARCVEVGIGLAPGGEARRACLALLVARVAAIAVAEAASPQAERGVLRRDRNAAELNMPRHVQ